MECGRDIEAPFLDWSWNVSPRREEFTRLFYIKMLENWWSRLQTLIRILSFRCYEFKMINLFVIARVIWWRFRVIEKSVEDSKFCCESAIRRALWPTRSFADFKKQKTRRITRQKSPAAFIFGPNPIGIVVTPDVSDGRALFVLRCVGQIYNLVNLTPSSTF